MRINGLTVCVNYADLLAESIDVWRSGMESMTVVTSSADHETLALCCAHGVSCYVTDAFNANGAAFNKGAAMQEAIDAVLPWRDWILFFDSDIIPPADWPDQLRRADLRPGILYGAPRYDAATGVKIKDREWPGYFQLFHSTDPAAQVRPLLDVDWLHAGNYDSKFQDRWGVGVSSERKVRLPMRLLHQGEIGNWWGRGPNARHKMRDMYQLRRERGGYEHERIQR